VLDIKISIQMFSSQLKVLFGSIPYIGLLILSRHYLDLDTWLIFSFQLIVIGMIHVVFVYLVVLNKAEKQQIYEKILTNK